MGKMGVSAVPAAARLDYGRTSDGRFRNLMLDFSSTPMTQQIKPALIDTVPADEALWICRCQQGDHAAFGKLVLAYQDRLYNLCLRMCRRREDAEDFTQEAFV